MATHAFRSRALRSGTTIANANVAYGAAVNKATGVAHSNLTATTRLWIPGTQANAVAATIPGVGGAMQAKGWRTIDTLASESGTFATRDEVIVIDSGNYPIVLRYEREGGTVPADVTTVTITAILYRLNASNVQQQEIGRLTSGNLTFQDAAQTVTLNINPGSTITCQVGDKLHLELYCTYPSAADVSALNLIIDLDEASGTGSNFTTPTYAINYSKAQQDPEDLTDPRGAAGSRFSLTAVRSDSGPLTDAGISKSFQRVPPSDFENLTDVRSLSQQKTNQDPENLTDASAKTRKPQPSDSENLTDARSLSRSSVFSDPENLTDSSAKTRDLVKPESENLTDARNLSRALGPQDLENLTDVGAKTRNPAFSDPENLTDSRNLGRGFQAFDTLNTSDSLMVGPYDKLHIVGSGGGGSSKIYTLVVNDGAGLAEVAAKNASRILQTFSDTFTAGDSFQIVKSCADVHTTYLIVSDPIGIVDIASRDQGGGMTAFNYPNTTLVAVAWLKGVPGVNGVATQLPQDNTTWGASGFVTVHAIAGAPNAYLPQSESVVQVNCYAIKPSTGRPLWNVANNVASMIIRGLHDETTKQRSLTLPTGYAPCRVIQATMVTEPTRMYADMGSYAFISFNVWMRWTLLNKVDV